MGSSKSQSKPCKHSRLLKLVDNVVKYLRTEFVIYFYSLVFLCSQIIFLVLWLIPPLWPLLLCYVAYIYLDKAPESGGRPVSWVRNLAMWRWFSDYFPASIVKEAELDPRRNYIFGKHPHGAFATGTVVSFCANAGDVKEKFPGLNIMGLTMKQVFMLPLIRELVLALNLASVSKKSIKSILTKGPGHSCMIVVGGAQETLLTQPDSLRLVLKNRVGFVRQAIEHGADLVPVFTFGENHLFRFLSSKEGSIFSVFYYHLLGFFFNTTSLNRKGPLLIGVLSKPYRTPLVSVVGKPIIVEQHPNPNDEMVARYHEQYKEALLDLYNRNKGKYWLCGDPPEIEFV